MPIFPIVGLPPPVCKEGKRWGGKRTTLFPAVTRQRQRHDIDLFWGGQPLLPKCLEPGPGSTRTLSLDTATLVPTNTTMPRAAWSLA